MAAPALKDAAVATVLVFTTIGMVSSLTVAGSVLAPMSPTFRVSDSRLKPPCSNNQQIGKLLKDFRTFSSEE